MKSQGKKLFWLKPSLNSHSGGVYGQTAKILNGDSISWHSAKARIELATFRNKVTTPSET
jgi:hypothetical protein